MKVFYFYFLGITYNNSGKISSGSIIKIFDELSPFYTLKTKVKVNKYTRDYAALWHFTTGPNCCVLGSRIPGIFILPEPYNRFQISVDKDNNVDYAYQWNFTLNTWYEIELSQNEEGNNVSYVCIPTNKNSWFKCLGKTQVGCQWCWAPKCS